MMRGPPGEPGKDGRDGKDGIPGEQLAICDKLLHHLSFLHRSRAASEKWILKIQFIKAQHRTQLLKLVSLNRGNFISFPLSLNRNARRERRFRRAWFIRAKRVRREVVTLQDQFSYPRNLSLRLDGMPGEPGIEGPPGMPGQQGPAGDKGENGRENGSKINYELFMRFRLFQRWYRSAWTNGSAWTSR